MIRYRDGREVRLGDVISHAGAKATVVAVGGRDEYSGEFTREAWGERLNGGFLIQFENGALLALDEVDEDILFVTRGTD